MQKDLKIFSRSYSYGTSDIYTLVMIDNRSEHQGSPKNNNISNSQVKGMNGNSIKQPVLQ